MLAGVDMGEKAAERHGSVTGQGPDNTAGGDETTDTGYEGGQESEEEQPDRTGLGAGDLPVDLCEREGVSALQDGVKVANAVKDGQKVEKAGDGANDVLGQDGFGDVETGTVDM